MAKGARRKSTQIAMRFRTWGGKREGAGRKRTSKRRRVPHETRPKLASRFPVHITTRIADEMPTLRNHKRCAVIRRALIAMVDESGFRVCEFSVQRNHLHLICEAKDASCLSRGMKHLKQRIARGLNGLVTRDGKARRRPADGKPRTGSVFSGRYYVHILKTPREVRHALAYVIHNGRKHGVRLPTLPNGVTTIDPYTSAWWFSGWKDASWKRGLPPPHDGQTCVSAAKTWLLEKGWRRHGLIRVDEIPAQTP